MAHRIYAKYAGLGRMSGCLAAWQNTNESILLMILSLMEFDRFRYRQNILNFHIEFIDIFADNVVYYTYK